MRKIIFIFISLIVFSINAISQEKTYTEKFDSIFSNIRFDTLSTGILYSRVIPFANLEK